MRNSVRCPRTVPKKRGCAETGRSPKRVNSSNGKAKPYRTSGGKAAVGDPLPSDHPTRAARAGAPVGRATAPGIN